MKLIASYQVWGLLGRGGMGAVYKVSPPGGGPLRALKLLAPASFLSALLPAREIEEQFLAEAALLAGLDHPHVVGVLDQGRHQGRPWYVMEYHCRHLGQVIGEGPRLEDPTRVQDLEQVLAWANQALEGLAALHGAGLVHRDLKPANLLLSDQDQVKICDFGLARAGDRVSPAPAGLKVGSPFYAAPEQEQDPQTAGPAADLYSLGMVLRRLLTGRLQIKPGQGPSALNPDLDQDWERFWQKSLAPDPQERFASALEMQTALEELAQAWRARQESICRAAPHPPPAQPGPAPFPRSQPGKVPLAGARQALGLDRLWRPRHYPGGDFQAQGADLVADLGRGLLWQQAGSPGPLPLDQARAWVQGLNQEAWAGRRDWRLPTLEELITLLRPLPHGQELCWHPLFSGDQPRLWSSDACTFTAAWCVDAGQGCLWRQDHTCPAWARAICAI